MATPDIIRWALQIKPIDFDTPPTPADIQLIGYNLTPAPDSARLTTLVLYLTLNGKNVVVSLAIHKHPKDFSTINRTALWIAIWEYVRLSVARPRKD